MTKKIKKMKSIKCHNCDEIIERDDLVVYLNNCDIKLSFCCELCVDIYNADNKCSNCGDYGDRYGKVIKMNKYTNACLKLNYKRITCYHAYIHKDKCLFCKKKTDDYTMELNYQVAVCGDCYKKYQTGENCMVCDEIRGEYVLIMKNGRWGCKHKRDRFTFCDGCLKIAINGYDSDHEDEDELIEQIEILKIRLNKKREAHKF